MRILPSLGVAAIYVLLVLMLSARTVMKRAGAVPGEFLSTVHPPLWWWVLLLVPPLVLVWWTYIRNR